MGEPLGHAWNEGSLVADSEANPCEEGGMYIYLCTREGCNASKMEVEEGRGHTVSNWSVDVEPTDETEGLLTGECTGCQETIEIVLPKLNDASVADGTYTKTTKVNGGCAEDSTYTYTYDLADGEQIEIDSFVNPENKTTVTVKGAFSDSFDVVVEGGFHYTVDIDGNEVAIDDTQPFGIEAYPEFKPFGNKDKEFAEADCETLIEEGAYFMCKHCGEVIAINVYGYHDYDEEKVVYHEATCTTPAYTSVYCNTEGEEIVISEGTQVDPDNHVWGEPIVEPSEDGKTATVTFVCELCDEEKVIENAELVSKDVSYEDEFACMGDTITTYVYKDTATGELYTVEIRTDKVAHYITVDGERIEITDEEIENHVFTDEDGAFLDKVGNIDPTCSQEATRCRYFTCECCDTVYTVLYKQAHQKSEEVTPATCTEDAVWHCDRCGEDWTEEGTALGHDYVLVKFEYDVEKNTFTLTIYCSRCEEIGTEGEPTELTGKYTDLKITTVQEQSCSKDGIIDIEYTDPSTEEEYSFEGVNLGKAFHSYDGIVMDDSQTYNLTEYPFLKLTGNSPESCQGTGDAYFICEHCGELILLKVTGPHTKGDLIEEATCDHPAKYECTECGEQFYDGKPLEHSWAVESSVAPAEDTEGSVTLKCSVCGGTHTVKLPKLSDESWEKTIVSSSCENGVVYKYSIGLSFEITVEYGDGESCVMPYTFTYAFQTEPADQGHSEADVYYEWTYPEGEDGVTYVGYICDKCGKMIVVWRSDKNAAEDKPADTIVLDPEVVAEAA